MLQSPRLPRPVRFLHTLKLRIAVVFFVAFWLLQGNCAFSYPPNSHYVQILPKLFFTVYDHTIPEAKDAMAQTFVTDGLKPLGQREIILTILNPEKRTYKQPPDDVVKYFRTVYKLAEEGRLVSGGDFTRFGDKTHFLAPQFQGLIYLNGSPPPGVLAPLGSLIAIPVTAEELDANEIAGSMRVTGGLSSRSSYFPYPYWCDLKRSSVFSTSDIAQMKEETIAKCDSMGLNDASACLSPSGFQFVLPRSAQKSLSNSLNKLADRPVLLRLGMEPNADGEFVWSPKDECVATAPPGSRGKYIAGSFIMIIPTEESTFGQLYDGFFFMLTADQWKQFQTAVKECRSITLTDANKKELRVVIPREQDPVDFTKNSYIKSQKWLEKMNTKASGLTEPVKTDCIVLLTYDSLLKQSITADDLTAYIKKLEKSAKEYYSSLGKGTDAHQLVVQTRIEANKKPQYKIFHRPEGIDDKVLEDLKAKLATVECDDPANPVDFELVMTVWR